MFHTPRFVQWLSTVLLLSASVAAQTDPNDSGGAWPAGIPRPLPDADVRLAPDGTLADWVGETNAELRTEAALSARAADLESLSRRIPFLRVDDDPVFGTPRWVASTARFLTAPVPGDAFDAVSVARAFVAAHPGLFEIPAEELDFARRSRDYATRHNGIRHLTFQQQIGGIDLFGAELRANVSRHGELINVSSTMLPRPEGDFSTSAIALTPLAAIRQAAASIGTRMTVDPEPLAGRAARNRRLEWSATPDFRTDFPVSTELVFFPMSRADVRAAWRVFLPEIGVGNTYEFFVDAGDGRILLRRNHLRFAMGGSQPIWLNVYTKDSPGPGSPGTALPNGFQFPVVSRTVVAISSSVQGQSPNGWINDGSNDTQGNNVDAHTDLDSNNMPDLPRPTGSPYRAFNFPQNNAQEPSQWREAAVTNLFYHCNIMHDRLFSLGFDEAAGNFQTINFSGQGLGDDRVQADCQDGTGTNNANFYAPADGTSGRMQMYRFPGPTPGRDGSLDSDIIYHEYTHGLSCRLHDLEVFGTQAGGMGEGWSDLFAIAINSEPTDDPNASFAMGAYTTYELAPGFHDNYYFGIRRFPASQDMSKNPMTYGDIDPAQQSYPPNVPRSPVIVNTANQIHNIGNLWCSILLDVRANLWDTYGFAANDKLLQILVDAMKLDPGTPDFLQARDAILLADYADFGGADVPAIWNAFAKRGCGYSAISPGGATSNGIVEAFDLPVVFHYPSGIPTQLPPNTPVTIPIEVDGITPYVAIPGTGTLHLKWNTGAFTDTPLVEISPNHYEATIPGGACFDQFEYYVSTETNWGPAVSPGGAPANVHKTGVFLGTTTRFDDDFQADRGWVVTSGGAISGAWMRGVPVNDPNWAYDPITDADGSGRCYVTGNVIGNSDVDGGSMILSSPVIDMTGGADVSFWYYLYLTDETPDPLDGISVDRMSVRVNNGTNNHWYIIKEYGNSSSTSWRHDTILGSDIQDLLRDHGGLNSNMRIRFVVNDADPSSVVEGGLDGFQVRKTLCSDPVGASFCSGDGSLGDCPCANNGSPGSGCANSVVGQGARLIAAGTTNPDTVVLMATQELPNSLTLFVQGDTVVSGVLFGDGMRCVGGSLKRLYAKNASSGQVSAPGLTELPITVQSAALGDPIASGETRYYFTWYRDPSSGFCPAPTGSTYNASNAFSITW